nr:MAG TPA: hypothetical protein [Caudoviricetes sp.]
MPFWLHYKDTNNILIYKYICIIFLRNLCF